MYPLFETLCVKDGVIQNLEYHLKRFKLSFYNFYNKCPKFDFSNIKIPAKYCLGIVKLKIFYNNNSFKYTFENYKLKSIQSLKITYNNVIIYDCKYTDRRLIDRIFFESGECDDILIIKNNLVTDTSICNIVFYDGNKWITPLNPLLKGTARERLLTLGKIKELEIKEKDILNYQYFRLINAMRDFDKQESIDIINIKGIKI